MTKKFLFLIVVFQLIILNNFVLSDIIPLKKPSQTKEVEEQKLLIDVLKPLPKPTVTKIIIKEEKDPQKKVVVKKEKSLFYITGVISEIILACIAIKKSISYLL